MTLILAFPSAKCLEDRIERGLSVGGVTILAHWRMRQEGQLCLPRLNKRVVQKKDYRIFRDFLFKDKATFIFEDRSSHHPELKLVRSQKILKE